MLEEFYISHNGVERLEGLENNVRRACQIWWSKQPDFQIIYQKKLRTLDVGNNYIKRIENISHLTELEEVWVSANRGVM